MENHRRDDSPSGLSDIVEGDGLLGTGLTVSSFFSRSDTGARTPRQPRRLTGVMDIDPSS